MCLCDRIFQEDNKELGTLIQRLESKQLPEEEFLIQYKPAQWVFQPGELHNLLFPPNGQCVFNVVLPTGSE